MAGRPTVKTEEISSKIEEAAALGASIEEIAFYAGIHRTTLYRWMKEDEELKDRIEELEERPILKARRRAVVGIDESYSNAMDYLSRKRKSEFSLRQEHTGADGKDLVNIKELILATNGSQRETENPDEV